VINALLQSQDIIFSATIKWPIFYYGTKDGGGSNEKQCSIFIGDGVINNNLYVFSSL
jgi:hypothetical protein